MVRAYAQPPPPYIRVLETRQPAVDGQLLPRHERSVAGQTQNRRRDLLRRGQAALRPRRARLQRRGGDTRGMERAVSGSWLDVLHTMSNLPLSNGSPGARS